MNVDLWATKSQAQDQTRTITESLLSIFLQIRMKREKKKVLNLHQKWTCSLQTFRITSSYENSKNNFRKASGNNLLFCFLIEEIFNFLTGDIFKKKSDSWIMKHYIYSWTCLFLKCCPLVSCDWFCMEYFTAWHNVTVYIQWFRTWGHAEVHDDFNEKWDQFFLWQYHQGEEL